MIHKHAELIKAWTLDSNTEFEFAYGVGVDFIWVDCSIEHVINNPQDQIRIKKRKPKKEKRWIGVFESNGLMKNTETSYKSKDELMRCVYAPNGFGEWQFIEIEIERRG